MAKNLFTALLRARPCRTAVSSKIREILQDAYFVLPKPEKYEESSKQIHEIMSELFAEKYEINSDLVEARSAAIVASIIFDEIMEGTD